MVENFRAIQKSMKRDADKQALEQKKLAFQDFLGKLFDICSRKCRMFEIYNCSKVYKVPKLEKAFLEDQRSCRKMIGSIYPKETLNDKIIIEYDNSSYPMINYFII